jgi:hypothetical protein
MKKTKKISLLDVGTSKYLMFDDALTQEKKGFVLTMNLPARSDKPAILPDQSWEKGGIHGDSFTTVMEDEGVYKLWYGVDRPGAAGERKNYLSDAQIKTLDKKAQLDYLCQDLYMLCYAVSKDGIHWEKPHLGIHEYEGSKKNNIVLISGGGNTVFKDPTAGPASRYKMIFAGGPRMIHHNRGTPPYAGYMGIYGAASADGIHWKKPRSVMQWYTDCTAVCYWDECIRKYVAFVRYNETMTRRGDETFRVKGNFYRAVGRAESDDFWNFPQPAKILEPAAADLAGHADAPGIDRMEIYNTSAVKYPFAADSYFMFPGYYRPHSEMTDIGLATSRDGVNYTRWPDPYLGVGQEGAFDSKMVHMATGMIVRDSTIAMYYIGSDYLHDVSSIPPDTGGVGKADIRLDGFVSQDAGRSGGNLVTIPLKFSGSRLELNMDAAAGGHLKVELLGKSCKPIVGYARQDADRLRGNDLRKTVTWNGASDLAALKGQTVRLNFIGKGVKLYAFQFPA